MIHTFSHPAAYLPARYFERAAKADRTREVALHHHPFDVSTLRGDDILVCIDPLTDWPLGLETTQGLNVVYLMDVHLDLQTRLWWSLFFDVVFVAQKDYTSRFLEAGHSEVHWLPLACDPELHATSRPVRDFDVGFVGQFGDRGSHRWEVLTSILPKFTTNDYSRLYTPKEMAEVYARSKIVFNVSVKDDLNMRFFEALASGALLITERIPNGLVELFQEGVHYVGYTTIEEAFEKIRYYLQAEDEREAIARRGQSFAFERHTYADRWEELLTKSAGARRLAPARRYSPRELGRLYSDIFASLRRPGRIPRVAAEHGVSGPVVRNMARSCARWINARIPLTPGAIKARLHATEPGPPPPR